MSYNKKVWKSGDRITKEALNNMENGIEAAHQNSGGTGSVSVVDNLNSDSSTSALSAKQGKELNNKMPAKSIVEGGKIYLAKEDGTKLDSGTQLPTSSSTPYDDTGIKTDINTIKTDLGTEELTTTAKNVKGAINEVNKKIGTGATPTVNSVEPELMDMPRIYFSEGILPTSKTATTMKFDYYSKTNEYHGYVDIKCQGTSSMSYAKKNFTIKPYKDKEKTQKLKIDFKGWGKQNKFCLKANWIDITHARNVVSARLWGDVIKTRSDYATALPELLRTSPNQGAIDGFPVLVYSNGVYQGRYTLNIPKDKWMSNMDDTLDTHCILCGENYVGGCFRALPVIDSTDWTDEVHDVVPAAIKTSWTNVVKFVMNSSDAEFKANLGNYFDVNSLVDYLLYGLVSTNLDGFGKNQLYFTYDGVHWIASVYDLDSTWGLWWNGQSFVSTGYAREEFQDLKDEDNGVTKQGNLLYLRLQQLFIPQLKTRYAELRKDVLSASHIIQKFEEFNDVCPKDIVQEDYASTTGEGRFTDIPSTTTNNIQQLRSNIVGRLTYVDGYINALQEPVPCTNIALNNATLSFTTDAAQTLTATVTPTNTTDKVVWSVSPTGICTVDNGNITPIKNGQCVVTATCGSHSATCNVTVNLPVQAVTALNLDKDSITLGTSEETTNSNTNLLDGVNSSITENNNITFDSIEVSPGIYIVKNINKATFTWIGCKYNGVNTETSNGTDPLILQLKNKANIIIHAYPNNNADNTADKLGVYKLGYDLINPMSFTIAGSGYFNTDTGELIPADTDDYSAPLTLDSSKKYILMNDSEKVINPGIWTYTNHNGMHGSCNVQVKPHSLALLIENSSSFSVAMNRTDNSILDFKVYELTTTKTVSKFQDTLTATLTPTNATNKNVTWTANNENVQLVANGLECTVKAKAIGDSIVTCTSQDTTNGTIADTCNVTVSAVPAT